MRKVNIMHVYSLVECDSQVAILNEDESYVSYFNLDHYDRLLNGGPVDHMSDPCLNLEVNGNHVLYTYELNDRTYVAKSFITPCVDPDHLIKRFIAWVKAKHRAYNYVFLTPDASPKHYS